VGPASEALACAEAACDAAALDWQERPPPLRSRMVAESDAQPGGLRQPAAAGCSDASAAATGGLLGTVPAWAAAAPAAPPAGRPDSRPRDGGDSLLLLLPGAGRRGGLADGGGADGCHYHAAATRVQALARGALARAACTELLLARALAASGDSDGEQADEGGH
jgi:hypothetical protein